MLNKDYPGVSLRAGLSTVSFAQVFWGLMRFMESQKDATPIPNAIYGKHIVLFSEDKTFAPDPLFRNSPKLL
jgi:hypothetical protein